MSGQESLFPHQRFDPTEFEITPKPDATRPQEVLDTSIKAYHEIKPTLGDRDALVLELCLEYFNRNRARSVVLMRYPTGYEVLRIMESRFPHAHLDVNSVRPSITRLYKERQLLAREDARRCTVTGKTARVWRPLVR